MNSKGFKNFSQGNFNSNLSSNPRKFLPVLFGGALLFGLFQSFYYGTILI